MDIGYILRSTRHRMRDDVRGRPALSMGDSTLTYSELDDMTNRYANTLIELGVRKGDHVAVHMHNSLDYVALYLAITTIGAVVVRINFRLHPTELEFVLRDSQSMLCITDVAVEHTETEGVQVPGCRFFLLGHDHPSATDWHRALQAAPTHAPDVPIPDGGDPAMLMYTSGTTGAFKGVEWTHDGTMWHAALQALHYGFSARTVAMTTGPLYHIGALETGCRPASSCTGMASSALAETSRWERPWTTWPVTRSPTSSCSPSCSRKCCSVSRPGISTCRRSGR